MKRNFLEETKMANTIAELKSIYKDGCLKLHPDLNPGKDTTEEMQKLNAAYEEQFKVLKDREIRKDKKDREKFNFNEVPQDLITIINELIKLHGVKIDIVGNWIWLSGDTFLVKREIKKLGFHWSKAKKRWFWNGSSKVKRPFKKYSYKDITEKYGCVTLKEKEQDELAGAF